MQMDNWYDLTIRELSELTDPVQREAGGGRAMALPEPALEIEDEETPERPAGHAAGPS